MLNKIACRILNDERDLPVAVHSRFSSSSSIFMLSLLVVSFIALSRLEGFVLFLIDKSLF